MSVNNSPLQQFDVVRLLRIDHVKYLSGPAGRPTAPKGEWSIVGFIEGDILLAKQTTLIRVPPDDVVRIAGYDRSQLDARLKQIGSATIDVIKAVSNSFNITYDQATELCRKYKVPARVDSPIYEQRAVERLRQRMKKDTEKADEGKG